MVRVPKLDPIDYLVKRKFPLALSTGYAEPESVLAPILRNSMGLSAPNVLSTIFRTEDQYREQHTAAAAYRAELQGKSSEEIERLCAREHRAEVEEKKALLEAAERRIFYNQPEALNPDYAHHFRMALWSLDTALSLSFGRDPYRVSVSNMARFESISEFARLYVQRWKEMQSAKTAGHLSDPVRPAVFISWMLNNKIELPDRLRSSALSFGIALKSWQSRFEEQASSHKQREVEIAETIGKWQAALDQARAENAALREQVAQLKAAGPSALEVAEQKNEQRLSLSGQTKKYNMASALLFGLAKAQYEVEFGGMARPELGKLMRAYEKAGMKVDDETLRKHLLNGSEHARLLKAKE